MTNEIKTQENDTQNSSRPVALLDNQMAAIKYREQQFELLQREAKLLANSTSIPESMRGNIADCAMIVEMAHKLKMDYFSIGRCIYVVYGKPSFSSSFKIGLVNNSKLLNGRLIVKKTGEAGTDSEGWFAVGIERETGQELVGPVVTMGMAKAEGWTTKKGSKWATMPDLMGHYRASTFWINLFAPEIVMGIASTEEVLDNHVKDVTPERPTESYAAQIKRQIEASKEGTVQRVNRETGEVVESSPAFATLRKRIEATGSPEDAAAVLKDPLFKRVNHDEQEALRACVDDWSSMIS